MSLVTVENLGLAFGARTLFEEVGFAVASGDRVGLCGRNGMGKTSLFRALIGELQPDRGEIRLARNLRLGYLPQDAAAPSQGILITSVMNAIPGRNHVESSLREVENELATATDPDHQEILVKRLGELQERFDHYETQFTQHAAERILTGLGFTADRFEMPLAQLSGGWRMRAALAALLFQQPDLLLLDEPTNHLDLPSVRWFDGFLQRYSGSFVLVSHDREFLNRQIDRVLSLEIEGLRSYPGNYDHYLQLRREEDELLQNRARNLERERRQISRFVERFKAKATKARAASSRAKVLRKMEKVETLDLPKELRFRFPATVPSGRQVLRLGAISKAFGDHSLYRDLDLSIYRGERVALVGANGCGKTTLLRIVAGDLEPDDGEIQRGHQVTVGYYAQHFTAELHPALTVLQTLSNIAPEEGQTKIRSILGTFLFSGDDVSKPVGVLSGGEKARVALARLVVQPSNMLVMDEPSNHLDLNASEALADALCRFDGTLLLVSHNLSLLRQVATKIWELRDGSISEYVGGFDAYVEAREREMLEQHQTQHAGDETVGATGETSESRNRSRASLKERRRIEAQRRLALTRRLGDVPGQIEKLESDIDRIEQRQGELEGELADQETYADQPRYKALLGEYAEAQRELDLLVERWTKLEEKRERIAAEIEADLDKPTTPEG